MLEIYLPLYFIVFLTTFITTVLIEQRLIPFFKEKAIQPIYEIGPAWHLSKGATPTMGGVAFLSASTLSFLICFIYLWIVKEKASALSLLPFAFLCISNALIGLFDDLTKLRRHKNGGLTPPQKLFLQTVVAVVFLTARAKISTPPPILDFVLLKTESFLIYFPVCIFLILGIVNCANLTDGIDGLASCVAFIIGTTWFLLYGFENPVCASLSLILIASSISFIIYNIYPARIFMGDTGSLFLGALAVSCAFSVEKPLMAIPTGIIYVVEGISVILQVVYYKTTKKRLFKMAPLHHHLEKNGMEETKICLVAILISLIGSLLSFILKQT